MESQLFQACTDGDLSTLKDLITTHRLNPSEVKDPSGLTLLHLACKHGHLDITQYLIREQNCSPETLTSNGHTPLHIACKSGHLHIVECLITEYKCNLYCTDSDGLTPLHAASENNNVVLISYLILEHKCDPLVGDSNGNTPLHYASESGHLKVVHCLIANFHCDPLRKGRLDIVLHTCKGGQLAIAKHVNSRQCSPSCAKVTLSGTTPLHLACLNGHLAVQEYLIGECACNAEIVDSDGLTPLHYACLNGQLDTVKFLLSKYNCNPQCTANNNGSTPLHYACENGSLEIVKYLATDHICNPEYSNFDGLTPLHYACSNGHLAVVKYLISELGCNPQIGDNIDTTPLHRACKNGHLEVAKFLVAEHSCNPDYINFASHTPLHYACIHGHLEVVKYLVCELNCDLQISDQYGSTPLHFASQEGHIDIVTFLISECDCDPQCSQNNGNSPLHCACTKGHLEVAKYLITEQKCSPEHGNIDSVTPLHLAAIRGHLAVVKYLISELCCNPQIGDNSGTTPLHSACKNGHLEIAKYLITEHKCSPEHGNKNGFTPLHSAASNGHLATVKYAISELGCNPQIGDNIGSTPLHSACQNGHLEVAKYLITEHKCNPERRDVNGFVPLHSAAINGHLVVVKYLISELGCNAEFDDNNGSTPLHLACQEGHIEVAKFLITEHSCNPDYLNFASLTPLHYACLHGHLAVVKYLVCELNCNLQTPDQYGNIPLHSASQEGHLDIVTFLISECNCDPECSQNNGDTPLHYACQKGHLEVAKYLITEQKCNPEQGDMSGVTPLHSAASNGHMAVVKYLISELGYNPQVCDSSGTTPLHSACKNGHLEVVKYLITDKHNCNPQCVDNSGMTPLHVACLSGHLDVVKYLIHEQNCTCDLGFCDKGFLSDVLSKLLGDAQSKLLIDALNRHGSSTVELPILVTGITPLHCACRNGHLEVTKHLITKCGCDPMCVTSDGSTPLHIACAEGQLETVKYLITQCKCDPKCVGYYGITPLHIACATGQLETVKYLITQCKCDPMDNSNGITPLHLASDYGHLDVVTYLIREQNCACDPGFSFNQETLSNVFGLSSVPLQYIPGNITPLHSACAKGHLEVAKHLVTEGGCDPKCATDNGTTPLHGACTMGQLETVKYLVAQCKCDPNCVDNQGFTPLHGACIMGQLQTVLYLVIECKCDPMQGNNDGFTPFHCACATGRLEIVKYLVTECKCKPDQSAKYTVPEPFTESTLDHHIIRSFDSQWYPLSCKEMLSSILLETGVKDITPLHVASSNGHLEIVKYLITECYCNPNSCTNFGVTPLGCALEGKHLEIVQYLIAECKCNSAGADSPKLWMEALELHCVALGLPGFSKTDISDISISPLQMACLLGDFETVRVVCECNPHAKTLGVTPLEAHTAFQAACCSGKVDIMKYLIKWLIPQCDITDFLWIACLYGHLDIVKFLIDECGSDPQSAPFSGLTALHATCTNPMYLIMNVQNLENNAGSNINKQGILSYIWHLILIYSIMLISKSVQRLTGESIPGVSNPHVPRNDYKGRSQLELKPRKFDIFKYLVAEQKCKIQYKDTDGQTPVHYACASGQLDIVQYIHKEKLSDLVHTTLLGDTPLHMACKYRQVEITEFLLSTQECDRLCKNAQGLTPLEVTTSAEIRELFDYYCNGKYPLESVVKLFVLGDPLAGKSSLVKALQTNLNRGFFSSVISRLQGIKGVKPQTAGIDSIHFSSDDFGSVVIYDFAGQREFLTSHAAFLQNFSSQLAGIFIVVTNIAQCENKLCQSLQYWLSFIMQCCSHCDEQPHILFVGSHEDQLPSGDIDQMYVLVEKMISSKNDSDQFYKNKGTVTLDCTKPVSAGLNLLRYYLRDSCNLIREHAGKIDQRCYVLHRYIRKNYTSADVQGLNLESISKDLEGNSLLLPSSPFELLPLFQTLHDKGQVLLLRNNQSLGKSWVITDIAAVLEKVIGSMFAPPTFQTHISPGSTGVVSKSTIRKVFPVFDTDMIMGFLEHFEFCHLVEPGWINLTELEQTHTGNDDKYYLFPALITSDCPMLEIHKSSFHCGWLLHSSVEDQFFTTRFLHVLLLRLAFLFSQREVDTALSGTKSETPAVRRRCKIWKSGITWHDANGVSTFIEVRDLRSVVLSMTSMDDSRLHCIKLRSQLIQTILKLKGEFCPRVLTKEFIVEVQADDILLQVIDDRLLYSIDYLSSRISEKSGTDNPDLTLIKQDGSKGMKISKLLDFEPYAFITPDLIEELFSKDNAKQSVSNDSITELAKWMYPFHDTLVRVLKPSSSALNKKYRDISDSLDEVSKQQLMCEHIIKTWVEQQQRPATYRNLRQVLDRYSIFCGRNPLNLIDESGDTSDEESDGDRKDSGPQGDQDQPTLPECIKLQGVKRRINLSAEIGTKYKTFGILLLEDRTGERVSAIAEKCMNDAEKATINILKEWIAGKGKHPVTWKTLTEVLHDSGLSELAGEIEDVKLQNNAHLSAVQVDQPTLIECVRFRGRERRINIGQEIGTKYSTFGTLLLEERTGERVGAIAQKHMYNSEQASLEFLQEWIAGRGRHPVTWNTLIEVLHDIELSTLAREIGAVKFQEGDRDRPTEVTKDSGQSALNDTCEEVTEDSDQTVNGEIPTGSAEDFRPENSDNAVSDTEANISVNLNPDLGLNFEDINDSETLENVPERKDQANNAPMRLEGQT